MTRRVPGSGVLASAVALSTVLVLALPARTPIGLQGLNGQEWARPVVAAGGLVFVSSIDGRGQAPHDGITGQTARVLERLGDVLESSGSSLSGLATVNVYLRSATDFAAMNEAYRAFFPADPPTRTTIVADLPEGALVAMSAVAVANGGRRDVLHPAGWKASARPYSYVVRTEHLVFFSGLVSRRGLDDQLVPGPLSTQMKTILDNARVLLRTADLDFRDVVSARVFVTDELYFVDMNDAYRRVFPTDPPARATAVARLMSDDSRVEVTFIASTGGRQVFGPTIAPSVPLSAAVAAGPFVFLSGVLGHTDANRSDPVAQMREVLTRVGRTLETAGVTLADVVDNVVYLKNLADQAEVDPVYREFFPSAPPARAVVGARLVAPSGLVEVMATAIRRTN